jgi:hypothetical protein
MNYYYKILLNLHRKPTTIYRSFHLPLHSTYHKSIRKSIGWETVASTNHTDRFWTGLDEIYDNHEDLD